MPGTTPPRKGRPVGYGVIRAGVRTDSMIGVAKFRTEKRETFMFYFLACDTISFHGKRSRVPEHSLRFQHKGTCLVLNPDIRERLWPCMDD